MSDEGSGDAPPHGGDGGGESEDEALLARLRAAPVLAGPLPRFAPEDAPAAPGPLFARWLDRALTDGVPEPQVMTLSTAAADGAPSARVLILRGVDIADCACLFASDAGSPKGEDLAANPRAALTWYWPAQGRQIRMAGPVTALGADAARADFLGRSPASRTAGFTGRTSRPLGGPGEYDRAWRAAQSLVAGEPGRVPDGHTVYRLRAQEAEFFQADPGRFHVRVRYTRSPSGPGWDRTLLWP
ncbi:pyridoxine/pyridoxamine 5'-phosphate oxidase [Actinacidiphila acidipaludis]|uniref:Pyridoxamine 5'-phosphate oxidase family protein n=1 Tax=Actinacidiphila acidipaludis TaxID=2873382 RepID=A0ABS7QIV4_9ACTN|nr:pyridoxamine 5'-phosphate oxidase family protein [Streptomyces acidipaludis]MBY8882345.1 pyridoxamine 5'-phosphate oxidase family protein [Streptomyces acidipaludis]